MNYVEMNQIGDTWSLYAHNYKHYLEKWRKAQ